MKNALCYALIVVALLLTNGGGKAVAQAQIAAPATVSKSVPILSPTPLTLHWRQVATSSNIFCGRITSVTEDPPRGEILGRRFQIKATCNQTLKGERLSNPVDLTYTFPKEPRYEASIRGLAQGQNLLFFSGGDVTRPPLVATDALIKAVKDEIENQTRIATNFEKLPAARPDKLHGRIKMLINILRDEKREGYSIEGEALRKKALQYLQRLGPAGVPSVIRQLNDRRKIFGYTVMIVNPPYYWESHSPQTPNTVVDLLAPFLPMMTGPGGLEFSEGSDAAIAGWRVWLCYTMAADEAKAAKKTEFIEKPLQ